MDKYDLYELLSGAQALFDDWNGVTGALHEGTSWHSELREGVIEDIVAYVYGKTLLLSRYAQPSEKPLTLDELRGMDGEPVWVERLWGAKIKKWIIASPNEYGLTQGVHEKSQFMAWKTYGVLWRALRTKPKEDV